MDCNTTEAIVNNMISMYSHCAAIQTANIYLSQTTFDLYRTLDRIYKARMNNTENQKSDELETNEMIISNQDEVDEWCIINIYY